MDESGQQIGKNPNGNGHETFGLVVPAMYPGR
jgi:hypothetical protein